MATIENTSNVLSCSLSELHGAGELGCNFNFENLKHVRFYKKGYVQASTNELTKAQKRIEQQAGNLVVCLNDLYDFTWNIGEDQREQAESTGLSSTTRKGIYGLTIKRRKGLIDQKVLNSLDDSNYDVVLVDIEGNELLVSTSGGGQKGFTTSMIAVDAIMFKSGTVSQKTSLTMEFSNATQFNANLAYNAAENLPYLAEEITDPNQVKLTVTAPSDGDTSIVVKTVLERGGSFVSGLAVANYLVKVNGATVTPSGITADADAKTNALTVSALSTSDTIEVKLYDSSASSSVIILNPGDDDVLYKSNSATSVVVA
tara:strand:+ start:630 stop:1574 length:945 start_codon:yes stop_codon:yes gene_type:complete